MRVLFVCSGNVGRSQMAESIFRQLSGEKRHDAQSAGTHAMGSDGTNLDGMLLKDRSSSRYVIECLREIGIDVSENVIKRLTPEMTANADEIVVMVRPDSLPDFLKGHDRVIYWDITDPDGQSLEFHRRTRDRIQKAVQGLIDRDSTG